MNIVMQIMPEIYLTGDQSHQRLISSKLPSSTIVTENNMIPLELDPIHKQDQCTQEC